MHFHLPIHIARGRNLLNLHLFDEDWQSAMNEIEYHPHEARTWTARTGFFDGGQESHVLPVHVACSSHAPLPVVRAIVEAFPECLTKKESLYKRLPIHLACRSDAPASVIEYLAQENRRGILEPDNLGRIPLHYACSNGASVDVVRTLLRTNPLSGLHADCNGWLPLHIAIFFGASTEVVRELVSVSPAAAVTKTKKHNTPMNLAEELKTKNKDEVIALLSDATVEGYVMQSGWSRANVPIISRAA
ncbi:hypothetical protein ACHAWF_018936 [Thalassiosira exigua]